MRHKIVTVILAFFVLVVIASAMDGGKSNPPASQTTNQPAQQRVTDTVKPADPVNVPSKPAEQPKTETAQAAADSTVDSQDKAAAQKELDEVMALAKKSGLVSSYEFSNSATVVYVGQVWYTQTVQFKKDFMAKIAMLKKRITGYQHFEVRDANSDEKVGEVTAFGGSLKVYK
ncbi:MAG: hypothetical protein WC508_05540 [Patescibacteria group bacterium]